MVAVFIKAAYHDERLTDTLHNKSTWRVHSLFNKSLNIQSADQENLMLIAGTASPRLPKALYLPDDMLGKLVGIVQPGQTVSISDGRLIFDGCTVVADGTPQYQSRYATERGLHQGSLRYYVALMAKIEKLNGFDFMMADLTRDSFLANTPEGNHILRLYSGDAGKRTEAISYFIGRGKGLTPSGDDLLVGALAADQLLGMLPSDTEGRIRKRLSQTPKPTTTVSEHYLACALEGLYNEPIHRLLHVLRQESEEKAIEECIKHIMAIGHTSGMDMLTGLTGALLVWNRFEGGYNQWRKELSSL